MTLGFNLELSTAQAAVRDSLHTVARNDLRAHAAEAERDGLDLKLLAHHLAAGGIAPAALIKHGVDDPHTLLVAMEELAYGDPGIAWAAVPSLQIATVLSACSDDAQREAAHAVVVDNDAASTSVLLYEDFGRRPSEFTTQVSSVEGGWTVSGRKASVAHPAGADLSLLVAREGDELAAFCFVGARSGLTAGRDDRLVGKVAITAVPSGPVSIDRLFLPKGERLAGGVALHRAVGQARLLLAAALVGTARASLEFCSAYALHRTTWGTPIAQYQGVSFPLIELSTELEEVRLLMWDVADRLARLTSVDDIERQVARALNRASSLALRATRDGVQLIGVRAITRDLPSERWYRSAAVLAAVDFDVLATPFELS